MAKNKENGAQRWQQRERVPGDHGHLAGINPRHSLPRRISTLFAAINRSSPCREGNAALSVFSSCGWGGGRQPARLSFAVCQ